MPMSPVGNDKNHRQAMTSGFIALVVPIGWGESLLTEGAHAHRQAKRVLRPLLMVKTAARVVERHDIPQGVRQVIPHPGNPKISPSLATS
jgi:hypothetical protein